MSDRIWTPQEVIDHIARTANNVGRMAGVGGCDIAGLIVSVLSRHPEQTDEFMRTGSTLPDDPAHDFTWERGSLTVLGMNGAISTPDQLHRYREVQRLRVRNGIKEGKT